MLYKTSKRAKEMHESTRLLLENMADTVDNRDQFTHEHSKRVTEWTRDLVKEVGLTGVEAQLIHTAARVHDIGKITVPDSILHKHERLTPEEWEIMEAHPARGAEMLERYPAFARGAAIVRSHHERFDGQGYPDKIRGTDIPFGARVIAVADSFDAMVSDRPYRKGMPWERAAGILSAGRGTQWDPELVAAFLHIIGPQLEAEAASGRLPSASLDHPVTV
jgi:putative nucleotidyltransferase with HDIG domain